MAFKNKVINNTITGQKIKFLQTNKDTNGELLEMESSLRPFSKEPPPHFHPRQKEIFKILRGELKLKVNGRLMVLPAGSELVIPPNTVHSMWNDTNETTLINWKVFPAMDTEYLLETTTGLANDGKTNKHGRPNLFQVALLASKFAPVFVLSKPPLLIQKALFKLLKPLALIAGYQATYCKYIN